jgi:hypothetical protein
MNSVFHHGSRSRHTRWLVLTLLFGAFAGVPRLCAQGAEYLSADQVKAGFIYNFTRYVEFPSRAESDVTHFHVCTAGQDGVIDQLEIAVHGKVVDGRSIVVVRLGDSVNVIDCEVLYVGNIRENYEQRLAAAVSGLPVLTVGSRRGFLVSAGMLTFVLEESRVRFDIDLDRAQKLNIHFDSRLLALARRTDRGTK